jgi:hypothetical protein
MRETELSVDLNKQITILPSTCETQFSVDLNTRKYYPNISVTFFTILSRLQIMSY